MELKVEKTKLVKVLKKLSPLIKTSPLPIIENFLVSVDGSNMEVMATNLEIFGKAKLECQSEGKFSFCINAQKFNAIVNGSNKELSMVFIEGKRVEIKDGRSKHTISIEPAEHFPQPDEVKDGKKLVIPNIVECFKRTTHLLSNDPLRRTDGIVNIDHEYITATDGFSLVMSNIEAGTKEGESICVPYATSHIIAGLEKDVELEYTETDLIIKSDGYTYYSKMDIETFPNYRNVIPEKQEGQLKLNVEDFKKTISTVMVSADPITKRVVMELTDKLVKLRASNAEYGYESEASIDCEFTSTTELTEPAEIAFNGSRLLNMVNISETPEIIIQLNPNNFKRAGTMKTDNYTYLIMPVSVI